MKSIWEMVHEQGCTPMGEYKCQVPMALNGRRQDIDYCIADIVAALNAAGIATEASCCGHGDESIARIDLEDGRVLQVSGHTPLKMLVAHRGNKSDRYKQALKEIARRGARNPDEGVVIDIARDALGMELN